MKGGCWVSDSSFAVSERLIHPPLSRSEQRDTSASGGQNTAKKERERIARPEALRRNPPVLHLSFRSGQA